MDDVYFGRRKGHLPIRAPHAVARSALRARAAPRASTVASERWPPTGAPNSKSCKTVIGDATRPRRSTINQTITVA